MKEPKFYRANGDAVDRGSPSVLLLTDVSWREVQRQLAVARLRRAMHIADAAGQLSMAVGEWLRKPVVAPAATG